jgi:hypothetical protein
MKTTPISLNLKADERTALDRWRRQQDDPPSRPAAIRQILREALSHNGAGLPGPDLRHV